MLELVIKTVQTVEATRQIVLLQRKPKEVNFTKSEKLPLPVVENRPEETHSHKGQNPLLQQRKNNRMQILFILTLSRQLSRLQPNLQHLQKTQPFCKNLPLKQTCYGNYAE